MVFGGFMGLSFSHLLLVLVIVLVVFGAGRIPRVMGDIGKGVRSLREGLKGDEESKKIDEK
jgi:sec-independent protein translocase protein TatA